MEQAAVTKSTDNLANWSDRPLQAIPYSKKDKPWFISNVDHYIKRSHLNFAGTGSGVNRRDLYTLYGVYNNKFPLQWFAHITNPLSTDNAKYKNFPAKVRPVSILRTNIDLLLGEWPRRPYVYNVENMGDSGYNRFTEGMKQTAQQHLTQQFVQAALQQAQAQGQELSEEQLQQLQQDPGIPEEIKAEFQVSYKDAIAIKANKWLRKTIRSKEVKQKQHKMFKDWLIVGEAYSYKGIKNDSLVYSRIPAVNIDFDMSDNTIFVEDGEWVVNREYRTLSDIVDEFYESLREENLKTLESNQFYGTAPVFYEFLGNKHNTIRNRIPVYHVQWKGRKKIGFLSYMDPDTFQMVEEIVDEDYIVNKTNGEIVEWRWVNEVYEGWRIGHDIYTQLRPVPVQRNEMNNHSACKLSYNGRKYSDTHAENISVLEIGIPFQIMYIIVTYLIEKTIAKSKGKIALMDLNAIPDNEDWTEEKVFYYAEAMGYMLIDRNQQGVDKSWNQYQVLDLSLYDQIKQLIELQQYFKQEWDDIIGITRQRKGQTLASDGQGVNERATFQSGVITDMIFIGFEELVERDLQGLLDYAKFLTSKGDYSTYNDDDFGTQLLEIMPEDFVNEDLNVFVERASESIRKLEEMRSYAQAMLQNDHKASTVLEIIDAINISELKAKLKQIEAIDEQIQQMQQDGEHQAEQDADQRKMQYAEFEAMLGERKMEKEYDRKEDIEFIKGSFNTFTFKDGDSDANGIPDATQVAKLIADREKTQNDFTNKVADRQQKYAQMDQKERELKEKMRSNKVNEQLKGKQIKAMSKRASAAKKK